MANAVRVKLSSRCGLYPSFICYHSCTIIGPRIAQPLEYDKRKSIWEKKLMNWQNCTSRFYISHESMRSHESITKIYTVSKMSSFAVADPGFPIGGAWTRWGGMDLRCRHFSVKMYAKMKELGPIGGGVRPARPPPQIRQCFVDLAHCEYKTLLRVCVMYIRIANRER